MNIKRLTYNAVSVIVAFVLVFGTATEVFAEIPSPNTGTNVTAGDLGLTTAAAPSQFVDYNLKAPQNQTQGIFSPQLNAGGFNGSLQNGTYVLDNSYPSTFTVGADGKAIPSRGIDTAAQNALNPPGVASSTGNGTVPGGTNSITTNIIGCSAGQLLASVITSGITAALNGLNTLLGIWTGLPVHDAQSNNAQGFAIAAEHGFQIFGVYVGVSLNSIAYCIVNSILEYIANSTIAWANSGFNGNPAFVQNPERFFQGLADQQRAEFINALAYNTQTNGTAMNVCQPFRTNVALGLANAYGRYGDNISGNAGFANYGSCGISQQTQNDFISGKDRTGYWTKSNSLWMNGANNYVDTYLNASNYIDKTVAQTAYTNEQSLNRGGGYQDSVVCIDPKDRNTCNIVVPGSTINKSVQNSLNSGLNRLVAATKFDQVVAAIVNNLIRIALNKLLTPVGIGVPQGTNFINKSPYSNVPSKPQTVPKAIPVSSGGTNSGSGGSVGGNGGTNLSLPQNSSGIDKGLFNSDDPTLKPTPVTTTDFGPPETSPGF